MNAELKFIFDMTSSILHGESYPRLEEDIDLELVLEICKKNHITPLIASGLVRGSYKKDVSNKIIDKFLQEWKLSLLVDNTQKEALSQIEEIFNKRQIDFIPLKGVILKELYPSSELRMMSDLDILYREENECEVDVAMKFLEYDIDHETNHHNVYVKKPFLNVEMHKNLVNAGSFFDGYYKNFFKKANKIREHRYEMSWNDYYIYHIVHFYKHFVFSGCGIRFLIDQYVLQTQLKEQINREYVDKELKTLRIYEFEQTMILLAEKIFTGKLISDFEEKIILYMIDCGMYGTKRVMCENNMSLQHSNAKLSKIKTWVNIVFMPLSGMRYLFPYIDRYPILLPIGWIHRWIRMVLFRWDRVKEVYYLNEIKEDKLASRREFLNKVGVNEKYL